MKTKYKLYALLIMGLLILLTACNNLFEPPKSGKPVAGEGTFSLEIGGLYAGRTILPTTVQYLHYTLVFSSSGREDVIENRDYNDYGNPVTLFIGTWNLTVTAYSDFSRTMPIAQGSLTGIVINTGENTSRSLEIKAAIEEGASGTFSWNITYPSNVTIASMTITPLDEQTGTPEQTLYFVGGEPLVNKNNSSSPLSLNTGFYRVVFSLSNGEHETGMVEYLHIYKNMNSSFTYGFTQDHFTVYSVTNGANSGLGSLRDAITNAPNNSTILIEDGVGTITLTERLSINKNLIIHGNGVTITRDSSWTVSDTSQLMYISGNNTVTISRFHFKDGRATSYGGAVRNEGNLTLESCIFSGNQSSDTNYDGGGGAIYNQRIMNIKGCTFYGNSSGNRGGAVYSKYSGINNSTLTLEGNLFYGNTAADASYPVVSRLNSSSDIITSLGYNVVDVPMNQSGWTAVTGDITIAGMDTNGVPLNPGTFAPVYGLGSVIPNPPPDGFPDTDFHGNARTFPGAPGASANGTYATCTVSFDRNGGSGLTSPSAQTVYASLNIILPATVTLTKSNHIFGGWNTQEDGNGTYYSAGSTYKPNGNITLYVAWYPTLYPLGTRLADKLAWLQENAVSYANYIIEINANEDISPHNLSYSGKSNIGITLRSALAEYVIGLSSTGSLFTVGSGVTLTLSNNITLQGRSDNNASLVQVNSGGALIMNTGSKITGNTYTTSTYPNGGGGVQVRAIGTFTMNGGEIANNKAHDGGGVYGNFTMSGGKISNNTAEYGGGVNGSFTMSGGEISGNIANTYGGGVYGNFTMSGGEISGNMAGSNGYTKGCGVYVRGSSTIKTAMSGGKISGNNINAGQTSYSYGGGVYVDGNSIFEMSGGEIFGNSTGTSQMGGYGGGVYVDSVGSSGGTFIMSGGEIFGNSSTGTSQMGGYGGGVHVTDEGTFRIITGTIYGSGEAEGIKNTATYYAALYGSAQHGTFSGNTWNSNGDLSGTSNTIRVMNGVLQGAGNPALTGTVSISGTAQVNQTLTANTGSLSGTGTIAYQWRRETTTIGTNSNTYTVQAADIGSTISVTVTRSGNSGSVTSTPTAVVTLPPPLESVTGLANKFAWLQANAQNNTSYTIEVGANESIAPQTLSYSGRYGISITLVGIGANRIISLSSNDCIFLVENGVTLILDNNITLQGHSSNKSYPLVSVKEGTLIMNTGSKISGNKAIYDAGTFNQLVGVHVWRGTFTMNGGEISGNNSSYFGGGVHVLEGIFTMNDGKISDNEAATGGGVCIDEGTFIMNGGEISGNSAGHSGGGLFIKFSDFIMNGGVISGNKAYYHGGGVATENIGKDFHIVTGTIYGSNESDESLRNTVEEGVGAALCNMGFINDIKFGYGFTWTNLPLVSGGGSFYNYYTYIGDTIGDTIKVVNGELQ